MINELDSVCVASEGKVKEKQTWDHCKDIYIN